MSTEDFDPIDLALLAAGWTTGADRRGTELSITRAEELAAAARMLTRLYREVADEWDSVWGYEVAEPLGVWIGRQFGANGHVPLPAEIEAHARGIVADAMNS